MGMKRKKTVFILIVTCMLSMRPVEAYWSGTVSPATNIKTGKVVIGKFARFPEGPMKDENGKPIEGENGKPPKKVIVYDPKKPDEPGIPPTAKEDINPGDIIIVFGPNNSIITYESKKKIKKGEPVPDPSAPNTSWWKPMEYSESTAEYRWFHRYLHEDYVIFENKIYRHKLYFHDPNTNRQKSPAEDSNRWEEVCKVEEEPTPKYWYRYVIYNKGDEVTYKDIRYRYISKVPNSNKKPGESNVWEKIKDPTRSAYANSNDSPIIPEAELSEENDTETEQAEGETSENIENTESVEYEENTKLNDSEADSEGAEQETDKHADTAGMKNEQAEPVAELEMKTDRRKETDEADNTDNEEE